MVGVQVQDQVSKKESHEYRVVCCRGNGYEGMQGGDHLEDKGEDRGDGKMREG